MNALRLIFIQKAINLFVINKKAVDKQVSESLLVKKYLKRLRKSIQNAEIKFPPITFGHSFLINPKT